MEIMVGCEGNDEVKFEDSTVFKGNSELSSLKQIADPVVYKLVRVEGDGRFVPATDDEVMEVENLLEGDKNEMDLVEDTGQGGGCTSSDGFSSGLLLSDNLELDAERLDVQLDKAVDLGRSNAQPGDTVSLMAPSLKGHQVNQPGSIGQCSNPIAGHIESGSSSSAVCTTSKPDFSKLQGEICLDKLSVKELHETFRATFGRETSVKDKQWLKRRIAIALANSCDVTSTTFVIKDNRVVKKGKEEICKSDDGTVVGAMNDNIRGLAIDCSSQTENHLNVSVKGLGDPILENDGINEEFQMEQRAAKRLRKPTRRYIEEISEVEYQEYGGKVISSVRNSGDEQASLRSHVRSVQNVRSDRRSVVTRQDSLGGSGIQVPFVSRVRRGRPRENFMALMKLQPSGMGMAAKLVKKALGVRGSRPNNEKGNNLFKVRSASGWIQQPLISESKRDEQNLQRRITEFDMDVELKSGNFSGDSSDVNVVTVPTLKGGMRRKHHRPWTLSEVVKLVEGVARYGAGRWSEIKKLAFASYSYRTAVDLKDKWRNLLRASFAQLPADKGMQISRKHASMPIPAPILSRVRELAEMQSQDPPNLSSSRFDVRGDRSVHETRSGYL